MSDKVSQLRSRLRFTCDEFKNIVNADLVELKWKTFQMIMLGLFATCTTVREDSEAMQDLFDRRQKDMANERAAGLSRSERNQTEHEYRSALAQHMLDGLVKLKWPEAMVAFSNPLKDLIEDHSVKISAIEYVVDTLNPPRAAPRTGHRAEADDTHSTYHRVENSPPQNKSIRSAKSATTPPEANLVSPSLGRPLSTGARRGTGFRPPSSSAVSPQPKNSPGTRDKVSHTTTPGVENASDYDMSVQYKPCGGNTDVASLQTALQLLQFQNDQLTQAMTSMMSAITARDEIEDQIERTLHDLTLAIAEIAGTSSSDNEINIKAAGKDKISSSLKREPKLLGAAIADAANTSNHSVKADAPAAPMWRAVRGRVESLYRQWIEARKSCRDAVIAQIEVHPSSSKLFSCGGIGELKNTTDAPAIVRTGTSGPETKRRPFMTSFSEDANASESGHDSFLDLSEITAGSPRGQSRMSTARSVSSVGTRIGTSSSTRAGFKNQNQDKSIAFRTATPSTMRVYQMLGLRPPKSVLRRDDEIGNLSRGTFELDRHRVFQLQRDLVDFSRAAYEVCCEDVVENSNETRDDRSISSRKLPISLSRLTELQRISRKLLIDTSALAPLTPTNAKFPMNSDISGLDALLSEVVDVLSKTKGGAKMMQNESITRAIERATTEQSALVQCLHFAEVHAKAQQQRKKASMDGIKNFKSKAAGIIDQCDTEIQDAIKLVHTVVLETERAESCLIELPTTTPQCGRSQSGRTNGVKPLDALSRGFLGSDVAALINSIRTFANNFDSIQSCLGTVRRHIKTDIAVDLERILANIQ